MTYKKPWLTSIIVMSIFALFGVLGIMVLAQSQDAENSDEGRGESHEGGSEGRDVRGNTDGEEAGRAYALDESHDVVRGGARLILNMTRQTIPSPGRWKTPPTKSCKAFG